MKPGPYLALAVAFGEGFTVLTAVEDFACVAGLVEIAGLAGFGELALVAAIAGPPANSEAAAIVARMFFMYTPPFVTDWNRRPVPTCVTKGASETFLRKFS
jgi:hypothetical protein